MIRPEFSLSNLFQVLIIRRTFCQAPRMQSCSIIQSCPTLCDPMNCSTPGLPVLHHLLGLAQTHVHCVSDAIQPYHPLSFPSPSAFNLSWHLEVCVRIHRLSMFCFIKLLDHTSHCFFTYILCLLFLIQIVLFLFSIQQNLLTLTSLQLLILLFLF